MKANLFGKQIEVKRSLVVIGAAVLTLLACLAGYLLSKDNSDIIIEHTAADASANVTSASGITASRELSGSAASFTAKGEDAAGTTGASIAAVDQIRIYLVGCVKNPGIVILEKGQVIYDAVSKAGGLTDEADAGSINMVYELTGNTMLHIKSKKELEPKAAGTSASTMNSGAADQKGSPGRGAVVEKGSGSGVEITLSSGNDDGINGSGSGEAGTKLININTADTAGLDKLPGIGEATAREIIAYREKNGPFRKIEDIMKVPRIKQARFDSIKDLICVY